MQVKVTEEHIRQGKRYSNTQCPIGRALRPLLSGSAWRVGSCHVYDDAKSSATALPVVAIEFIEKFDRGKAVTPISFEVDL